MIIPYFLVNSFTNKLSSGNPSGVCLLQTKLSEDQMQMIASKINVSETAFLLGDEGGLFLRWFTPTTEIGLCGHATLGTADILNIKPIYVAEVFDRYLFEVSTEKEVKLIAPDFGKLRHFKKVLVTSKSDDGSPFDFISRYFAPSIGVNEDPVTGTSHCCLAPYWAKKLNKTEFLAYQASARGGVVRLKLLNDIVQLSGQAVTTFHSQVTI
jgi:predicted PhzF superfamily epimerase YddE/YHI9